MNIIDGLFPVVLVAVASLGVLLLARWLTARPSGHSVPVNRGMNPRGRADSRLLLVVVGDFAQGVVTKLLQLLHLCGKENLVGSVLLIQFDRSRRDTFFEEVPSVYRDRIVDVICPALSGGFGNRSPEQVWNMIDRWGEPVMSGAEAVCQLHMRLHEDQEAALCLVFVSEGGTAVTGVEAVRTIRRVFPLVEFYGYTAWPIDDVLRGRVPTVLKGYYDVGVHGFVMSDNLADAVVNDFAMVRTIVGPALSAETADTAVALNNFFKLLFGDKPGGIASYGVAVQSLPAFPFKPIPFLPTKLYYVFREAVISSIINSLEHVSDGVGLALGEIGRDSHAPDTSHFDIVITAVVPEEMKADGDQIIKSWELKAKSRRNNHLLFASIAAEIDPLKPVCPVAVISIHAFENSDAVVTALATR